MFPRLIRRLLRRRLPVSLGALDRATPVSNNYGFDRGLPIDRLYIEEFLGSHAGDIRGRVLEIKDASYTMRFGSTVTTSDVLDIDPMNAQATIVADLSDSATLPADRFDCFILTQTIHVIYDFRTVLVNARRLLRPGGVLLATVPVVSRIVRDEGLTDYWRFTPASTRRLAGEVFGDTNVSVQAYGNVLAGIATLAGLAVEDVDREKLIQHDPAFPVIVALRTVCVEPT